MRRTAKLAGKCTLSVMLFALLSGVAVAADTPIRAQVEQLFSKAVKHHGWGEYDQAAALLDKLLALEPTSNEAWLLREQVGLDQLVKMLQNHETAVQAREILRKAHERSEHLRRDEAEIRKFIDELASSDSIVRLQAINNLVASGPFAVPYLIERLLVLEKPSAISVKVNVKIALFKMHEHAVPPIAAALWHCDDAVVEALETAIARMPDARFLPPLLAILEDPKRSSTVKLSVETILKRFDAPAGAGTKKTKSLRSAAGAAATMAERHFYRDTVLTEIVPPRDRVIWKWNPKEKTIARKLVFENVPPFAYSRILCHEVALYGLEQVTESIRLLEIYASNNAMFLDDALAASDERAAGLERVLAINKTLGAEVMYASLKRAVADRNALLAHRSIEALRDIGDPRKVPGYESLVQAMSLADPMVRASAAETLMRLSPKGTLGGAQIVIARIATGLGLPARPVVAMMSADGALARRLARDLAKINVVSATYKTLPELLAAAESPAGNFNMLILDVREGIKSPPIVVKAIRDDATTSYLPITLISVEADRQKLLAACGNQVIAVLTPKIEPATLSATVDGAMSQRKAAAGAAALLQYDVRKNAAIVRRVLRTVAALPANTAYPAGNLAKPISSLAKGYPEDIRILALDALTNLGDAAFRNLAFDLYADENESAEIRRKAGQTFLALLPAAPMLAEDQRGILRKMTSAEDSILASQAVHALGIAAVPAAERKKQLNKMDDETPALR